MKKTGLGVAAFSLLAMWTVPSLAAETEAASAGYTEQAEQDDDASLAEFSETFGCEDVGEAQQCWDWQCTAAVVGGAAVGGLTGFPAGPWGVGVGIVGGGLLGYGTSGACTPQP